MFSKGVYINGLVWESVKFHCCCIFISGVKNVTALGNLIRWQKVEYDFNFHKQDFPCNVSALILSEGKSMLPVSVIKHFYALVSKDRGAYC